MAEMGLMWDCSLSRFMTWVVNSLLADSYFYNSVWYVPRICAKLALRTKGRKGKMSEKSRKGRKGKSRGKGGEER